MNLKVGDRVRVRSNGVTNGKTGTISIARPNLGEYVVEFDKPLPYSGKHNQVYRNKYNLVKLVDDNAVTKQKNEKKTAVFIEYDDTVFMKDKFHTIEHALKAASERTNGDPDFAPTTLIWEGEEYDVNFELNLTAEKRD